MSEPHKSPLSAHLQRLKDRSGLSLEKIARLAGYSGKSSVQRYFDAEDLVHISNDVARKLAQSLYGQGDPPISLADLSPLLGIRAARKHDLPLEIIADLLGVSIDKNIESEYDIGMSRPNGIPIVGAAYASSWMEKINSIDEPQDWLLSHDAGIGEYQADYALKIIGPSLNKIAPEGSFAICRRYNLSRSLARDGAFMHVEREKGDLREWTIKRVAWDGDKVMLVPHSNHPAHKAPIDLGNDDDTVSFVGIVIGWYIPA